MNFQQTPHCCSIASFGSFDWLSNLSQAKSSFITAIDRFLEYNYRNIECPLVYTGQLVKKDKPIWENYLTRIGFASKEVPSRHRGRTLIFYWKEFKTQHELKEWIKQLKEMKL